MKQHDSPGPRASTDLVFRFPLLFPVASFRR
ncbi:hypothetical protein ACVW19_006845 [Streptomyces sp. TE5632]